MLAEVWSSLASLLLTAASHLPCQQGGDLVLSVRSGTAGPSTTHYSLNLTALQASWLPAAYM